MIIDGVHIGPRDGFCVFCATCNVSMGPPPAQKPCPHCGKLMEASTPAAGPQCATGDRVAAIMDEQRAQIKDAIESAPLHGDRSPPKPAQNIADEPPPSGYMSRNKLT